MWNFSRHNYTLLSIRVCFSGPFLCCLRQFALTCFARHTLQFQSFVWFRLFALLLFFCFFLLIGVPAASADWFDGERWNFWRVMVPNEQFISNSNYKIKFSSVFFFNFVFRFHSHEKNVSKFFARRMKNIKIRIIFPMNRLSRQLFVVSQTPKCKAQKLTEMRCRMGLDAEQREGNG